MQVLTGTPSTISLRMKPLLIKLFWTEERVTGGEDPVELGSNNSGQGVGGSTVHYSMIALRLSPDDFRRRTLEGAIAGADLQDWPLSYEDLEPYYDEVEAALQIAGPVHYPWQKRRRRFPQREHQLNASANMLVRGCSRLGIPVSAAPVATLSAPHADRPPCVYRGFCNYGCSTNAKSSILVTYIPRAIRAGAEVRPERDGCADRARCRGRVTGVLHFRGGAGDTQRGSGAVSAARQAVVLAGYAIESPRLLLNSASALFPDGLANSSGRVGRCFMIHAGHQMFAQFPQRIGSVQGAAGSGHHRALQPHLARGGLLLWLHHRGRRARMSWTSPPGSARRAAFGARRSVARCSITTTTRGSASLGKLFRSWKIRSSCTTTERDRYGLPVAHVLFSHHENDQRLIEHSIGKMGEILRAAGGEDVWGVNRTAHLMGTCRMGRDPAHLRGQRGWSRARRAQSLHQ